MVVESTEASSGVRGRSGKSAKNLLGSAGSVTKEKELGLLGSVEVILEMFFSSWECVDARGVWRLPCRIGRKVRDRVQEERRERQRTRLANSAKLSCETCQTVTLGDLT